MTVSYTTIQWGSADPNWGSDEFLYEEYGKNEYKSEEEHSKQVYDWEILELFFLHHNLDPNFYYLGLLFLLVTSNDESASVALK